MFASIQKFLSNALTEADNSTFDLGRILWAVGVIFGLLLEATAIFSGHDFDLQAYGVGVGSLLGAGGLATAMKAHVETTAIAKVAP